MKDLITVLREIKEGVANPSGREIAVLALDLVAKQVRQSWETRSTENQEPWKPTVLPSFAGVLHKGNMSWGDQVNIFAHVKDRESVFYLGGKGQMRFLKSKYEKLKAAGEDNRWFSGDSRYWETYTPTWANIAEKAMRLLRSARVTDTGFETPPMSRIGMWQSEGTDNPTGWGSPIPARSFWAIGDDVLNLVAGVMADKAAQAVARAA